MPWFIDGITPSEAGTLEELRKTAPEHLEAAVERL